MTTRPQALRLADEIDPLIRYSLDNLTCSAAATELRRLHNEILVYHADRLKLSNEVDQLKAALAAPVQEPGPSGDYLSDFQEGQWWLAELDAAVANGTHDQKRAVAVVRNLLATVAANTTPPAAQRQWVGLTDEEANELWESTDSDWELMKRTEAKLRERNGG